MAITRGVHKLLLAIALLLFVVPLSSAATTEFTNQNALFFTGTSSAPGTLYQDAIGDNADVGIELCDLGSRFVGGFYAINVLGTFQNTLVTYQSSTNALAETTSAVGGGCFQTPAGFVTVSPSELTTPNPDVKKAAFPGYLWTGYSASANPGSVTTFVFGNSSMYLRGSYSLTRTFDQSTRLVSISTPQIVFETSSGSFSKSASDGSFGISSENQLALGICDDAYGVSCSDGEIVSDTAFPKSYDTGLLVGQVNDQNTHTKYAVANSLGYDMCIGANLAGTLNSVTPDPVYFGQNLTIAFTVSNPRDTPFEQDGGNVDVDTNFDVEVRIYNTSNPSYEPYAQNFTITTDLSPDGSQAVNVVWPANALSGFYTVEITIDSDSEIVECDEGDNTLTTSFELKPVTIPTIEIDGTETDTFPYAYRPYELYLYLRNSDNLTLSDANVVIEETNGLSINAPTQYWNATNATNGTEQRGINHRSLATFQTNTSGESLLTYIPTYNKFFSPQYAYLDVASHIDSYNLTLYGNQSDGEEFVFVVGGQLTTRYPLFIDNTTGVELSSNDLPQENIVAQAFEFAYQIYTNIIYTITS